MNVENVTDPTIAMSGAEALVVLATVVAVTGLLFAAAALIADRAARADAAWLDEYRTRVEERRRTETGVVLSGPTHHRPLVAGDVPLSGGSGEDVTGGRLVDTSPRALTGKGVRGAEGPGRPPAA